MSDSAAYYDAARRVMVASQLRPQGVTDGLVLAAMGAVPRQDHVGTANRAAAYGDRPLMVDGAPIMPPAELGQLLTRLAPRPGERALVVGGGGAYAAAVLRHIGLDVDIQEAGTAPVDLILVEGAIERLAEPLAQRLSPGGRVGAAIVEDGVTRLAIGTASATGTVGFTSFAEAQVPRLPGTSSAPAFAF